MIMYAWLDHRPLEPFVEGANRNPIWATAHCRAPTGAIGRAIVAWHNERSRAAWNACIIITWQDTRRPDFLCVVRLIVRSNLVAESLVHLRHIAMLDAPVTRAEQMNTIEDIQQTHIDPFRRPYHVVVGVNLLPNRGPFGECATTSQRIPEEEDRFAVPVKEVRVILVMRLNVAQSIHDIAHALQFRGVTLEIE